MAAVESSSSVVHAEALTYTLCLSSKIELILKEEQKLFVLLERGFCMAPRGIREEYLIPVSVLQAAHSAGINK